MTRDGQGALERLANLNAERITQDSQRTQHAESVDWKWGKEIAPERPSGSHGSANERLQALQDITHSVPATDSPNRADSILPSTHQTLTVPPPTTGESGVETDAECDQMSDAGAQCVENEGCCPSAAPG